MEHDLALIVLKEIIEIIKKGDYESGYWEIENLLKLRFGSNFEVLVDSAEAAK